MSFDKPTRNALASMVGECRRLLTNDVRHQLQAVYGLQPDGTALKVLSLGHLDEHGRKIAQELRDWQEHVASVEVGSEAERRKAAFDRLANETAFTVLNRLAALRMCEERGHIIECVGKGMESDGFVLYERFSGGLLGTRGETYRTFLERIFDELAVDLGALFDPITPQSLVFPGVRCLEEVLAILDQQELSHLWKEDETIGWVYQYFNSKEERGAMRKASSAPQNSRELAVRNQFFTPRYVVEFLTDNTLGRIWYEMTRGHTRFKDQCHYLVRRPIEIFLGDPKLAYDKIFGTPEDGKYNSIPEAYLGSLSNLPTAAGPSSRWISVAIPPTECEKITGEPYQPFESDRLGTLIDDIINDHENTDAENLATVWAAISRFTLNDGAGAYSIKPWNKLWAHFLEIAQRHGQQSYSQAELQRLPVFTPHRPLKDPRTIRMLDPACGSMHFGLYAFDLFELIYDEAWQIAHGSDEAQKSSPAFAPFILFVAQYPDRAAFLKDVPRLIIEHNLHGIDIDPRAVQIAGLSLWLRAQRSWQQQGLRPQERPRIRRSNIVCAEPMPGEEAFLNEFIEAHLSPTPERKLLGQLVRRVFGAMKLAGEAGSLLRIEEEIAGAVTEAKQKWVAAPKVEQGRLFADTKPVQRELGFDVTGITDETFWEKAEERIYGALQSYAERAEQSGGYQRRLFADDAARGFAFIDLCRKRYDVVVMNPPFGELSVNSKDYLFRNYDDFKYDIYAAFVIRGVELLTRNGELGALTSRTGFFLTTLQKWRAQFITRSPLRTFADLGLGVLDSAAVEACCFTVQSNSKSTQAAFINCLGEDNKGAYLRQAVEDGNVILANLASFASIPTSPYAYWAPQELRALFTRFQSAHHHGFRVRQGLGSSDNFRFLKLWWEVPQDQIGIAARWVSYAKGGGYQPFWGDQDLCVLWEDNGREIKQFSAQLYGSWSKQITNVDYYFRPGLTYSSRGSEFSPRTLPRGSAFDTKGSCVFDDNGLDDTERLLRLLAIMQSTVFRSLLNMCVARSGELARSYTEALVEKMPIPALDEISDEAVSKVRSLIGTNIQAERWLEETHAFALPCMKDSLLAETAAQVEALRASSDAYLAGGRVEALDKLVMYAYRLDPRILVSTASGAVPQQWFPLADDLRNWAESVASHLVSWTLGAVVGRWDIRFATGEKSVSELPDPFAPLPICPPAQLQNDLGLPLTRNEVGRLKEEGRWNYPIEIQWDGILVDDPGHPMDIEARLHSVLQVIWNERWETIEREACEILGVRTLRNYLQKPTGFFADHLKRYSKSRRQAPIYWPLSTASGSYTLWVYYHRLSADLLFTAVNKFVRPKIDDTESEIRRIESNLQSASGQDAPKLRNAFESTKRLLDELREFRDELLRVADLPYRPNLNDGVLITASPLWKVFRLPKWRADLKECWEKLAEEGKYDWAHLAYSMWPDRVREACKRDRSIAIAHGLETLCEVPVKSSGKRRSKKAIAAEMIVGDDE
jgi:hypothetical protein